MEGKTDTDRDSLEQVKTIEIDMKNVKTGYGGVSDGGTAAL